MKKIVIGGGVSANSLLRKELVKKAREENLEVYIPSVKYCTDNASMIACAGYYKYKKGKNSSKVIHKIDPSMKLKNWN